MLFGPDTADGFYMFGGYGIGAGAGCLEKELLAEATT